MGPGDGRFIAVGSAGTGVMVKASATETGGLCTVWDGRVPPVTVGAGPHYHREREELFYVLEGELVLRIGDETHTARAGTFAFVPRETVHGFHNASIASDPAGRPSSRRIRAVSRGNADTGRPEREQRGTGRGSGSLRHHSGMSADLAP